MDDPLKNTFRGSVEEGYSRLRRSWPSLLATGFVGGVDVSLGLLGLFFLKAHGESDIAASLAFGIGFIALTMAGSELFTENFLVPITTVATGKARWRDVARLWVGTATMNLLGGLTFVAILMTAFPEVHEAALKTGSHFIERGVSAEAFFGAVVAGIIITLMTWMQSGVATMGAKLVPAVAAGFLLAYGELGHVVVASLEMFAAMFAGAPFGVAEWFPLFWQMAIGNAVGGIGLVTVLRLIQIGPHRLERERRRVVPDDDDTGEHRLPDPELVVPRP